MSFAEQIVAANAANAAPPFANAANGNRAAATELSADELLLLGDAGFEVRGIVAGAAVFHVGLAGARVASAELGALSEGLLAAREQATGRMRHRAAQSGADGVVGVRMEITAFDGQRRLVRVLAMGTAVGEAGAPAGPRSTRPFIAAMSVKELSVLLAGGYQPVDVVMGVCVYHIARPGPRAALRNLRATAELATYTTAFYEARELAMRRLQDAALTAGGDGVVGVTIAERSHAWGRRAIEFFCMGTTVRAQDERSLDEPTTALFARDPVTLTDPAALRGRSHLAREAKP